MRLDLQKLAHFSLFPGQVILHNRKASDSIFIVVLFT